jgi:hypothetical protein
MRSTMVGSTCPTAAGGGVHGRSKFDMRGQHCACFSVRMEVSVARDLDAAWSVMTWLLCYVVNLVFCLSFNFVSKSIFHHNFFIRHRIHTIFFALGS